MDGGTLGKEREKKQIKPGQGVTRCPAPLGILRPSPPPPPPPGAEGLAGEPAGGPAGRRAGQCGRLGAHALGNLQAPGPPACALWSPLRSRPDREVGKDVGPVLLSPARMKAGCDSAHPALFSGGETGGGRRKTAKKQAGKRHGRLRLLRFLPGRRLRPWLARAKAVAHFACHRGRKAPLCGCHVTALLSSAGRATTGRGSARGWRGRQPETAGAWSPATGFSGLN